MSHKFSFLIVSSNLWHFPTDEDSLEILLSISQGFVRSFKIAFKTLDLTPVFTSFVKYHAIKLLNSAFKLSTGTCTFVV